MSNFLVLGLIPGTPVQITFALWIFGVTAVVACAGIYFMKRAHLLRDWFITTVVVFVMRRRLGNQLAERLAA